MSIDIYQPYIVLIQELFPNAKIIIDRFHIVQSLNRALNIVRVTVMNSFKTLKTIIALYIMNLSDIGNFI